MTRQQNQDTQNDQKLIHDFFSAPEFLKRLELHVKYICKSKTKQQTTMTLYFAGLRQNERQLYLIDYQKCDGNLDKLYDGKSAEEVIVKYMEDIKKKLEDAEKAKKKQPKTKAEMTEEERKKYLDELAKPKDRFEKLKMLQQLLKEFPKDRVIQRMIDAELEANPDAPNEFLKPPASKPNTHRDVHEKQRRFQEAMLKEAQAFVNQAKTRPKEKEVKDLKSAIEQSYIKMKKEYREIVTAQFAMTGNEEFGFDKPTMSVYKTPFPEKFKRLFFKKLRDLGMKPNLPKTDKRVRSTRRKAPIMFMNAGSRKCTTHATVCPTMPCQWATMNKKIKIMLVRTHSKQTAKYVPS